MKNRGLNGRRYFLPAVIVSLLLFTSCGNSGQKTKQLDTPTNGQIAIGVDASYKLLLEAEKFTFEALYKYARVDLQFKTEADVINDFMNDSIPLMFVSRKLSDKQAEYLRSIQYIPRTTLIARDAIALVVNKENPDTSLFFQTVKDIFTGKITRWNDINPHSKLGKLSVVFDHFKSGNPRYFKERFALDTFPSTCSAVKSNEEVISYIENNKNGIGIVSVNWISDNQDSVSNKCLKRVKVVGIALEGDNDTGTKFYKPYQAYIAEDSYPFTRELYCINRQPYTGLAHGFAAFVAGEKGQLIVLHSGLVPAAMPVRIVEIKH